MTYQARKKTLSPKNVVIASCIAAALPLLWTGMNYSGFCHAEFRYLSDQEMIDATIQYVLDMYPPAISKKISIVDNDGKIQNVTRWYKPENVIDYKDISEFKSINPDCCRLTMIAGEGARPHAIDRLFGKVASLVVITYKVRFFENGDETQAIDSIAVAVRNCGTVWSGL